MKAIIKTALLLISAIIGLSNSIPFEYETFDTEIQPRDFNGKNYRLTKEVLPTKYELELTPNLDVTDTTKNFTFEGVVKINIRATVADVSTVVLHKKDLEITGPIIFFNGAAQTSLPYDPASYDTDTEKWNITLGAGVVLNQTAESSLMISFTGKLNDEMKGFYRSYYMEKGEKVWMASTQFQQTDARRAFPCFDEPGFKAPFVLTLKYPSTLKSVSNTPVATETTNPAGITTKTYLETPPMSTYLLAFIVSKYDVKSNNNATHGFGVYARPEAVNRTDLSFTFGQDMLGKLGTYLGIDYYTAHVNVKKMDMAAIPDFSAGAMENWGLLTYRETNILNYEADTPSLSQQRIVAVIAHEQAHMWFGDLVTCNWWSETWLNEGFARYFQFFGTEMVYQGSDWDLARQFVVENHQQSMQLDSTEATHPMTNKAVETQAQSSAMFDNISYNKASSIIRMFSHYIGLAAFQSSLRTYLSTYKNTAVTPENLFASMESSNPNAGVTGIWTAWTEQAGFPLVTVSRDGKVLSLSQKRFMQDGSSKDEKYNIPITYAIDSESYANTKATFAIEKEQTSINHTMEKEPTKYYILNPQQNGYYRVNYDLTNWNAISTALKSADHDKIDVLSRSQIVDDLFQLARAGIVKYDFAIDIIRYIKKETDYIPWLSAFTHGLTYLSQRVSGDDDQKVFAWFIRDLTEEIYKKLNLTAPTTSERRTDIYNRVNVAAWACKYGKEDCITQSKDLFAKFMNDGTKVHRDQRSTVYCNAVRQGNATEFNFLYDRFATEDISAEQLNLLAGMSCTKDVALVKKYMDRIITDDIRPQDKATAINNMINSNIEGPQLVFNYIKTNHATWRAKMGNLNTLTTVAGRFTTADQFVEYEAFLKTIQTDLGTSYDSMVSSMNAARKNLDWDQKYMKEFMEHLHKLNSAPAKAISILVTIISLAVLSILN